MKEGNKYLIDSNILVYAYDKSEKQKYAMAEKFMENAWNDSNAIFSLQNLVEFYAVVTSKIEKPINKEKAKQILIDCYQGFEIIHYSYQTVIEAINIQNLHKIGFWDALIAATMEENSIEIIYTENEKDFKKIPWIKVKNPLKKTKLGHLL